MDLQHSSQEKKKELALSWLWETFWLGIVLSILNILAAGQCLSKALGKSFLTSHIVLVIGLWFFLFTFVFWFLIKRIRQDQIWPLYLIIANSIVGIISIFLFLVVPRDPAQHGPSLNDLTANFNLSPNDAKISLERFKTCSSESHMAFLEYLSLFISAGLIAWTLYAAFILMNILSKNGQRQS